MEEGNRWCVATFVKLPPAERIQSLSVGQFTDLTHDDLIASDHDLDSHLFRVGFLEL